MQLAGEDGGEAELVRSGVVARRGTFVLPLLVAVACAEAQGTGGVPARGGGSNQASAGAALNGGAGAGNSSQGGLSALGGQPAADGGRAGTARGGTGADTGAGGARGGASPAGAPSDDDGGDGTTPNAGAGGALDTLDPDAVFRPSTRFTLVDPKDFGAAADDTTDDAQALEAALAALPTTGGIVRFSPGTYLKDQHLIRITKSHALLWAPNGRATIDGTVRTLTADEKTSGLCGVRQQALVFQRVVGGGVYGLRFTSNATERTSCAEDCQLVLDGVNGFDIVGVEVNGGPGAGIFAWSSADDAPPAQNLFIEGNFIHHTYADSIHHTDGTRKSACWRNQFFNEAPSLGDDGIACVTYGIDSPLCGDMEWWNNLYLGGAHGRGFAVVGGESISIHDNWVVRSASAGLIVASESAYDTASAANVELRSNFIVQSPNGSVNNGHSSILVSGGNPDAPPLHDIDSVDNVIVDAPDGRTERAEGSYDSASVVFDDSTDPARLPGPVPTLADVQLEDTSVLRTRDLSFVPAATRRGLYRIHLREVTGGGVEERFEYIVSGSASSVSAWLAARRADGAYVSETRVVGPQTVALVLSPEPLEIPAELDEVPFDALRAGDRSGELHWLWQRVDFGQY